MRKERKHYTGEEKVAILRRHLLDKVPVSDQKDFNAGLRPGEFIQVKVPFKTPDGGNEWMWVEITSWKGNLIRGILENDPFNVPELHAGQIVEVWQGDVFDYLRQYPDKRREGNTTGEIIRKMGQKQSGLTPSTESRNQVA